MKNSAPLHQFLFFSSRIISQHTAKGEFGIWRPITGPSHLCEHQSNCRSQTISSCNWDCTESYTWECSEENMYSNGKHKSECFQKQNYKWQPKWYMCHFDHWLVTPNFLISGGGNHSSIKWKKNMLNMNWQWKIKIQV